MKTKKISNRQFLCILVFLVVCYPVSCGYVMDGGNIREWIARMGEMAGSLCLFPSDGLILEQGAQAGAMNSNLWFLLPALLVKLTGRTVVAWTIFILLLQAGTMGTAWLMFSELFHREDSRCTFYGTLLYMTCPYRIYVCYDTANLFQAVVWMLLPLYVRTLTRVFRGTKVLQSVLLGMIVLAGIGYGDVMHMLILMGVTVIAAGCLRKAMFLLPVAGACPMAAPVLIRLIRYVFLGAYDNLNIPLHSITPEGYLPGEMLHMFVFHENHPGIGLGLLISLLCGIWLMFVKEQWQKDRMCRFFACMGVFLTVLSLRNMPWEYVQRLGMWAMKLVALLGTPAVFFGMAQAVLCVAGACSLRQMERQDGIVSAEGLPLAVTIACIGCCLYQCNMLVFNRMPI